MVIITKKAKGQRGQFWATVDGEQYGTIGSMRTEWDRVKGCLHYREDYGSTMGHKSRRLVDSLMEKKRAILTKETLNPETGRYEREGYIGLYEVDKVSLREGVLEFDLVRIINKLQ